MKVLLVTSEYGEQGGGLSSACAKFHNILSKSLKCDVIVISSFDNISVTAKGGYAPELYNKISNEFRLKNDISKLSNKVIDIVIAFGGSFNGYYATLLSQKLKSSLYLMLRGTDINMAKWDSQESFYIREAGTKAEHIICLSEEMKQNLIDILPSSCNKCAVIPNIIEPFTANVRFPNLPSKLVVGCSATHINEKKGIANMLYMVKAFKDISDVDLKFHIVGGIDNDLFEEYKKIITSLCIDNCVVFDGYMSRKECGSIQKDWDFYIQGSVCEGFCNSVGECISAGIPVFLSNTGYISEQISKSYPQLVFDSFAPSDMASRFLELVKNENKESLYCEAYSHLYEKTNEKTVIQQWKSILTTSRTEFPSHIRCANILPICLHDVSGELHDHITTPISVFEEFVEKVYNKGYGICSFQDYIHKLPHEKEKWLVCTFDDGYASLIKNVLPLFNSKGFTATVFINSDLIGNDNSWNWKDSQKRMHLNTDEIIMLSNSGWEIGSHGHTHRNLKQLNEEELDYEFSTSKRILQSLVGDVATYAYPYGSSSSFIKKKCKQYYNYAFSLSDGGTELSVDNMNIRRYSLDDVTKILSL